MDDIYKEAHIMTKKICEEYENIDYKSQFQLCLSYLSDKNINERIKEILSQIKVNEKEARLLEKVEYYYKTEYNDDNNLNFRLWQREDKRRVYITAPYIKNKTYVDLISKQLYERDFIKKF